MDFLTPHRCTEPAHKAHGTKLPQRAFQRRSKHSKALCSNFRPESKAYELTARIKCQQRDLSMDRPHIIHCASRHDDRSLHRGPRLGALPLKSPRLNNRETQGIINIAIGLETSVHDSVLVQRLIRSTTPTDDSVPLRAVRCCLTEPQQPGPTSTCASKGARRPEYATERPCWRSGPKLAC